MSKERITVMEVLYSESKIFRNPKTRKWIVEAFHLAQTANASEIEYWIICNLLETDTSMITIEEHLPEDMTFIVPIGKVKDFIV